MTRFPAILSALLLLIISVANFSAYATESTKGVDEVMEIVTIDTSSANDTLTTSSSTGSNDTFNSYDRHSRSSLRSDRWVRQITQMVVAVCGIVAFPAFVIIVLIVFMRNKRKMLLDKYQVIEHAMQQGISLPEAFFLSQNQSFNNYSRLRSSLIWIACGISVILFGWMEAEEMVAIGTLPLLIGCAKLAVYIVARRDMASNKNGVADKDADQI